MSSLLSSARVRFGLTGLAAVVFVELVVAFISTTPTLAYSTSEVNNMLPEGIWTAYSADTACKNNLQKGANNGWGLRNTINNGSGYVDLSWLSYRGRPNIVNPINVPYGTTSVPIQINSVTFLCAPLLKPAYYGSDTYLYQRILGDSGRWVTSTDARDRAPVSSDDSSPRMYPARTGHSMKIMSISVVTGGGSVSMPGTTSSSVLSNANSRYWTSNKIDLQYNTPSITSTKTVVLRLAYKAVARYFAGTYQCVNPSGKIVNVGSLNDYNPCITQYRDLTITLHVQNGWLGQGENYVYGSDHSTLYADYKNSNTSSTAKSHTGDQPTVSPGEQAWFKTSITNKALSGYARERMSVQARVDVGYFSSVSHIASCERQRWSSAPGCNLNNRVVSPILRGVGVVNEGGYKGVCSSYNGNIEADPDKSGGWDASGASCMRITVPADGSTIGQYVCMKTSWVWASTTNQGWDSGEPACAYVKSTFNLVPKIGDGSTSVGNVNQGEEIDAPSVIQNQGGILKNFSTDWATYDFKVTKELIQLAGGESNLIAVVNSIFNQTSGGLHYAEVSYASAVTACEWMRSDPRLSSVIGERDCNTLVDGIVSAIVAGATQVDGSKLSTGDAQVGDLVCRTMSIRHYNWDTRDSGNESRRVAYPKCYRVAKKPSVQIWGNDVRVGSNSSTVVGLPATEYTKSSIITAVSGLTAAPLDMSYGSWGEYGMVTPIEGVIKSSSSGGLSGRGTGGAPLASQTATDRNKLSFANSGTALAGQYGMWGSISAQPSVSTQFGSGSSRAGNISLTDLAAGTYTATSSTAKLSGEVGAGRSIIIRSSNTIVIDDNITYASSSYSRPNDITQLVIIAKNIIIKDNVTRVDAWLVATPNAANTNGGVISTCETSDSPNLGDAYTNELSAGTCNQQLTINGPVLARELQLRRTAGAEKTDDGDVNGRGYNNPAEIINMRADAYIWAANYVSRTTGNIKTDYTVELPPRY